MVDGNIYFVAGWQSKINDLLQKHSLLTKQISAQVNDTYQRTRTNRRARLLILKLTKQIERLFKLMATDECLIGGADNCKNGGTCIDGFGKFQCLCPAHFQGKHCEIRVDECAMYSGTAIGCQNGAKCTNNPKISGFTCNCTSGWHGLLCEHKENTCEGADDICGTNGHCIPSRSSQSAIGYRCICEPGFKQGGDPSNPICVDIDECALNNPCYPGNGLHCLDFDECANDLTNECSKQPSVECINIHGSYKCGECPTGYLSKGEKQGQICQKIDICNNPPLINGGCSPLAKCVNEPEFRCVCPMGMIGNGIGPDGCENPKINGTDDENLCLKYNKYCLNGGTCQAISPTKFRCLCPETHYGGHCEHPNPCLSRQFCSGHGRCQKDPLGCICFKGFYGPRCQFQEDGCGFHTSNETGELIYERTAPSPLFDRWTCTWHIEMFDTRKVLQINFLNFTAPHLFEVTSKGCENAFVTLTIFDGADPLQSPTLASTQIVNMCHGEDFEMPFKRPLFTSTNKAVIRLSSRIQGRSTFLHLNWTAKKPSCGGRFSSPNGGRIDYYLESSRRDKEELGDKACIWYVNVPPQFHIELSLQVLRLPSEETAIRLRFDKIGFTTSFGSCFYNTRQNNPQIQDYVELSGGHSSNEVANKRYICPRYPFVAPGGEIVTSGIRPFSITYSTSGSPTNKGFLFYYETFNVGCGGVFTINENGEQKITITSPNYPEPYIPFMYCVYFLRVPIGKAVRLSFDVFDVENVAHRDDCDFDNVRVFDTYTDDNEHGQLLGKFCGKSLPPPLISNSGQMAVVFISDRSVSGSGFSAKFQAIDLTSHCDRTFTASSGEFVFDFRNFEQNEYCNYKIQISSNRRILLNILNISSPCDYGTLMVRNGPSESSPGFAGLYGDSEICNENPIKQLISQGNRLFLRFRSITNKAI
uniref:Cubilin n=1 Tax=Meloidogyne javanica TaxID=6303 RepID=A0A915MM71_MELJA